MPPWEKGRVIKKRWTIGLSVLAAVELRLFAFLPRPHKIDRIL